MGMGMTMAIFIMMMMATSTVGACFRLELGIFFRYGRAQSLQHFLEHAILADAQKAFPYLGLRVPITQMKSTAQKVMPGLAGYTVGRLIRRYDLYYPAIIAFE